MLRARAHLHRHRQCGELLRRHPAFLRFRSAQPRHRSGEARPRLGRDRGDACRAPAATGVPGGGSPRWCRCTRSVIRSTWMHWSRWRRAGAFRSSRMPPRRSARATRAGTSARHGAVAALSFNGNKLVTTGGGGAILTTDPALGARRQASDDDGENAASVGVLPRSGRLQLPASQHQCGARLRAARAARCVRRRQAPAGGALSRGVRRRGRRHDLRRCQLCHQQLLAGDHDAGHRRARRRATRSWQACHARGVLCRPAWTGMHRLPMYQGLPAHGPFGSRGAGGADRQSAVVDGSGTGAHISHERR